jgi:hypothetical protein|nr:MAG TPA: Major capsid protein [Caudoviricetes sp.]
MAVSKNNGEQNQNDDAKQVDADDKSLNVNDKDNHDKHGVDDNVGNDDGASNAGVDGSNGEKTFTQDDVNRMMAREKKQGRNSVYNELGIDPNDTDSIELVKSFMSAKKQSGRSGSTNDDASAASQADGEKVAELEHRAKIAEAKAEAMMLGVKSQFVDDVVTLAAAHLAEQGENAEFKTVIGELKSKYPLWFGTDKDDDNAAGKSGTGSSINPDSGSNGSKKEDGIGKRLAAQRKPSGNGKKFSYWGKNN